MVLTQRAKTLMFILYFCWGLNCIDLGCLGSHIMTFQNFHPSISCYSCECYMCLEDQTGPGLSTSTCVFRFQGKFTVLCSEICWAGKRAEHVLCHDILIANTKASWSPEINDGWLWFEKVHSMPAKRDRKTRVCSNPKGFRREHWKTF